MFFIHFFFPHWKLSVPHEKQGVIIYFFFLICGEGISFYLEISIHNFCLEIFDS